VQAQVSSRFLFPKKSTRIVASAAPMESMVKPLKSYRDLLKEKADVWAVGPGLGKSRAAEILELIEKAKQPMVIDADGLNILAEKTRRSNIARANDCSRRIPAR
jgi:NAD(P)H-hydrate repair Nnr-like enzyme with NAD(P)H-hydrate dehydratase domain